MNKKIRSDRSKIRAIGDILVIARRVVELDRWENRYKTTAPLGNMEIRKTKRREHLIKNLFNLAKIRCQWG
jgi:hypothetical protein